VPGGVDLKLKGGRPYPLNKGLRSPIDAQEEKECGAKKLGSEKGGEGSRKGAAYP